MITFFFLALHHFVRARPFFSCENKTDSTLRSNNFNLSRLTLPCLQGRNTQRGRSGTHPRENRSESVAPAIGVCTKSLQITVGGIFEHKPLVVRWYPVRSTYLHAFSTPLRSYLEKSNSRNVGNTPAGKPKVVKKIRCDLLPPARPAGPDRPSNVCVVEITSPFSFSLSCSNLQIVTPKRKPPFSVPMTIGWAKQVYTSLNSSRNSMFKKKKARSSASRSASVNRRSIS